ncbi:MAG: SH3 domain-containing protein [Lachnospiraceae bacterium]|nr:SH3 domain-containing protein [Lachnospiraceae bacterium]
MKKSRKKSPIKKIFLLFFLLIIIVASAYLYRKYSYTNKRANLEEYIHVTGDDVAIFMNDENKSKEEYEDSVKMRAIKSSDTVYLPLSFVKAYINNRFYYAKDINKILYCLPDEIQSKGDADIHQIGNCPYVIFKEEPYLLIDFVKDFSNIRYDSYLDEESKRIYIYTDWDKESIAYMRGKEAARVTGGNKSPIVTDLKKGEEVKILEKMTKWVKVKTSDGYIGYIRKSKINKETDRIPISSYIELVRKDIKMTEKPVIGFHQVLSNYPSSQLPDLLKNTKGMNVIAPTWFVIRNNEGDIRSIANDKYSLHCHGRKLKVWATLNNFDLMNIDEKIVFSSTKIRRKMIDKILREVSVNNLDGINLDIEQLPEDAGEDYTEFVRELSIELNKVGCTLSIDTYIPYNFNKQYNLKEYNDFCDYVIIMAYDEHYAGSKVAGSVSSINYVRDAINLSLAQVNKEKLIIGLPLYTRLWTTKVDGTVTSIAGGAASIEQSAISQGLKFTFDNETLQNYGTKTTLDGDLVECWMEDDTSLAYKMIEIRNADLAGTAAWKLTHERDKSFSIISLNNDN